MGIKHVRLTETLQPGGSASAYVVVQKSDGYFYETQTTLTIHDNYSRIESGVTPGLLNGTAYGQNFGLDDEIFRVRRNPGTGRWECVGSQGLHRRGKPDAAIAAGSSGTVSIYHSPSAASCSGSDSTVNVTACAINPIQANIDVMVVYFPDFKNWVIVAATTDIPHMVGEIDSSDSPLASGSLGTINLYEQTASGQFPTQKSPTETVEAFNMTTVTLYTGALMYVRPIYCFPDLVVSPAQVETCLVPTYVPNTDAIGGSGTVTAVIANDNKFKSTEISAYEFPDSSSLSTGDSFRLSNVVQSSAATIDLGANSSSPLDKIEDPNDPTATYASSISGVAFNNINPIYELDKGAHYANPTWRVKG